MISTDGPIVRGKKLVVQMFETFQKGDQPTFVESLDAIAVGKEANLPVAPVMIYGDDVTHVITEEGIAYLYKAHNLEERKLALAAIAGVTPLGRNHNLSLNERLREDGLIAFPEDLGVRRTDAKRSLLAAKSVEELVEWSDGLYKPPGKFRSW
jgi:malonate decarboxylase alpha subunit